MSTEFSIVTPCLNAVAHIEQTLLSVQRQTHRDFEHIVVDGGSTDGTLRLLERHSAHLTLVSAPGLNQAAAINEGFRRASGRILAWLNADDLYTPEALAHISHFFRENLGAKFVYGDAHAIDNRGRHFGKRNHVASATLGSLLEEGDFVVQPAAFWTRTCWETVGPLQEDLEWTLDYEYWIRIAQHFEPHYLPETIALERLHGNAKTVSGGVQRFEEMRMMITAHGGSGVPAAFKPEACATYIQAALGKLLRFDTEAARSLLKHAGASFASPVKVLAFLVVLLLFGGRGLASARLAANRMRSSLKLRLRLRASL